ncbi:hypothetical protein RISK_000043 [Rhodopirellula islandica]|uniref:Uncharacterized protein n=1 Tax=Rhodopirellula islandica TaxID=595434 RepID=A0A0J1EQV8_RHOIS|nr:hypothetical protein RISK_000043 [Rhodopirellula islandica]
MAVENQPPKLFFEQKDNQPSKGNRAMVFDTRLAKCTRAWHEIYAEQQTSFGAAMLSLSMVLACLSQIRIQNPYLGDVNRLR